MPDVVGAFPQPRQPSHSTAYIFHTRVIDQLAGPPPPLNFSLAPATPRAACEDGDRIGFGVSGHLACHGSWVLQGAREYGGESLVLRTDYTSRCLIAQGRI